MGFLGFAGSGDLGFGDMEGFDWAVVLHRGEWVIGKGSEGARLGGEYVERVEPRSGDRDGGPVVARRRGGVLYNERFYTAAVV